jgi:hypothetical protein
MSVAMIRPSSESSARRTVRGSFCLACVGCLLLPCRSDAQTVDRESVRTELLRQATRARAESNWVETARLLRQATLIRPTNAVRLGLAGALQELGRHQEAAEEAVRCIQSASQIRPVAPDNSSVLEACTRILHDSSPHVAEVNLRITPVEWSQIRLDVDGQPMSDFARDRTLYLTPGPRRIGVHAVSPYDFSREAHSERSLTLRAGTQQIVSIDLGPTQEPSAEQRPTRSAWASTLFFVITPLVMGGAGLAVGATGVGYQYSAYATREEYEAVCSPNCPVGRPDFNDYYRALPAEANQLEGTGRSLMLAGGITLAVSAAVFALGYLIRPSHSRRPMHVVLGSTRVAF